MRPHYSVTTTVYDDGRVSAALLVCMEADTKPENRCAEKRDRDIYTDWFDTKEEAKEFVKEARRT